MWQGGVNSIFAGNEPLHAHSDSRIDDLLLLEGTKSGDHRYDRILILEGVEQGGFAIIRPIDLDEAGEVDLDEGLLRTETLKLDLMSSSTMKGPVLPPACGRGEQM